MRRSTPGLPGLLLSLLLLVHPPPARRDPRRPQRPFLAAASGLRARHRATAVARAGAPPPKAAPDLPSPEDKAHEPDFGYPLMHGAPNWWAKFYIPQDSGGTSKVPMPDGLMIAQSQALRTAHKAVPWEDAGTLTTPDGEWPAQEKTPFKPGTDDEYLASERARAAGEEEGGDYNPFPAEPDAEEITPAEREQQEKLQKQDEEKELLTSSAAAYGGDELPGSPQSTSSLPP